MADWTIRFRFGGIESSLEYLESMAAKGWMIEFWQDPTMVFTRCEPRKLRFAMDEMVSGKWDPGAAENESIVRDYVSMYEEMGWQYVAHQQTTFLFYTEDENLPLPQTDPVAFKNSIHRKHRRLFVVAVIMMAALLGVARSQYRDLYYMAASSHGLWNGIIYLLFVLAVSVLVLQSFLQWNRERISLRRGQIPKIRGYEGLARIWIVLFGLIIISSAVTNMVISKGTSAVGWGLLVTCAGMFFTTQLMPKLLYRSGRKTKREAIRMARSCSVVLGLVCSVLLANSRSWTHKIDTLVDPQEHPPIITMEELSGSGDGTSHYKYESLFAELYSYYDDVPAGWLSYKLYVSDKEWLLRSFERSREGSGFTQARVDWDAAVTPLDHEELGLIRAWYYEEKGMYSGSRYHYYLQTEDAALAIEVSEELSQEWLLRLSERLAATGDK